MTAHRFPTARLMAIPTPAGRRLAVELATRMLDELEPYFEASAAEDWPDVEGFDMGAQLQTRPGFAALWAELERQRGELEAMAGTLGGEAYAFALETLLWISDGGAEMPDEPARE